MRSLFRPAPHPLRGVSSDFAAWVIFLAKRASGPGGNRMVRFCVAAGNRLHGAHRVDPCAKCAVRDIAACSALNTNERRRLASIMTVLEFNPRRVLFYEGEPAAFVFTITEGVIKIYKTLPDGRCQVTGFLFPADFLGLVDNSTYAYSAETLTPSRLCRFGRSELETLLDALPRLEHRLLGMASHEIAASQDRMVLLGRKSARERVASFLLMLSKAGAGRDQQVNAVSLPMSRLDIADYLGLTMETVSRNLTQLRRQRLIEIIEIPDGKRLRVLDTAALRRIAMGD